MQFEVIGNCLNPTQQCLCGPVVGPILKRPINQSSTRESKKCFLFPVIELNVFPSSLRLTSPPLPLSLRRQALFRPRRAPRPQVSESRHRHWIGISATATARAKERSSSSGVIAPVARMGRARGGPLQERVSGPLRLGGPQEPQPHSVRMPQFRKGPIRPHQVKFYIYICDCNLS